MNQAISEGRLELRVRYAEVDAMGVLHHSRYFVYFEMGRTELLRASGIAYADMERMGLVRVDHEYQLLRGETLLAEASSTLALVDRSGRPTPLPDDLYERLARRR